MISMGSARKRELIPAKLIFANKLNKIYTNEKANLSHSCLQFLSDCR